MHPLFIVSKSYFLGLLLFSGRVLKIDFTRLLYLAVKTPTKKKYNMLTINGLQDHLNSKKAQFAWTRLRSHNEDKSHFQCAHETSSIREKTSKREKSCHALLLLVSLFVAVIHYLQDCSLKEVYLPKQFDLKVFESLTYYVIYWFL